MATRKPKVVKETNMPKTEDPNPEYMKLAYPEDPRSDLERQMDMLEQHLSALEKLLPRLRIKLSPIMDKDRKQFEPKFYTEDKADSVVVAILKEKNVRAENLLEELTGIIDSLQL